MKKISLIAVILLFLFCLNSGSVYPQVTSASKKVETKTADVNKDGKPDVTYYSDGEHVAKVEADTNYDGKPDVIINSTNFFYASSLSFNVPVLTKMLIYLNNGNGTFADKVDYTTGSYPSSVSIGDLNGDGKADQTTGNILVSPGAIDQC